MPSYGVQQAHTLRRNTPRRGEIRYLLFLPTAYAAQPQQWPLMLFLHGAGERGYDLHLVKRHGAAMIVEEHADFPFVVVSPQCPPYRAWSMDALAALLDAIESRYAIDPERIYVSGLSMGGFGTWGTSMPRTSRCSSSTSKATPV